MDAFLIFCLSWLGALGYLLVGIIIRVKWKNVTLRDWMLLGFLGTMASSCFGIVIVLLINLGVTIPLGVKIVYAVFLLASAAMLCIPGLRDHTTFV